MSDSGGCEAPRFIPTRENPSSDCGRPPEYAVPLGRTGRHLRVCPECAEGYTTAIPLHELEEVLDR